MSLAEQPPWRRGGRAPIGGDITIDEVLDAMASFRGRAYCPPTSCPAGWRDSASTRKTVLATLLAGATSSASSHPNRPTGRNLVLECPTISICGTIQPGTLARLLTPQYIDCGVAARILLAMPPQLPKRWSLERVPERTAVRRTGGRTAILGARRRCCWRTPACRTAAHPGGGRCCPTIC